MVAFPPLLLVPIQTHLFDSAFASLILVNPYRLTTSSRPVVARRHILLLNTYSFNSLFLRLSQHGIPKVMLQPLGHLEGFLQFVDPLLEIIMVHQMAFCILETLLARP